MITSVSDDGARRGLSGVPGTPRQCRTRTGRRNAESGWVALLLVLAAAGSGSPGAWPAALPPRDSFPPALARAVTRIWLDPTLTRTVRGRTARVPLDVYVAFVDAPDVIAAAARHRGLARYEVQVLGNDWYEATDNDGARGRYRVLFRGPDRRVVLSWGEHSGRLLGTISGSALTVLEFRPVAGGIAQSLTASVLIDNRVAARLARLLIPLFGYLADRKLTEGFTITARVAEWAVEHPEQFCDWLAREPLAAGRRAAFRSALPGCAQAASR